MPIVHLAPVVVATARPASDLDVHVLALPLFEDDHFGDLPTLDSASAGEIGRARARGELSGTLFDVFVAPLTGGAYAAGRVVLVGAGSRDAFNADRLRRVATVAGLAARQRKATRLAVLPRTAGTAAHAHAGQVVAEGVTLANYDGRSYKTDAQPRLFLEYVEVQGDGDQRLVDRGRLVGVWSNHARELVNAPGNELTPRVFAERARELGAKAGLAVDVLDEQRIADLGMGLLLGVARGSQEPPRMVVLRHDPAGAPRDVVLGLVGKGITFDTGGISIKPAEHMERMKDDMAGGAAVICAMAAIASLGVPVRCVGVVPMTENMPGGRALKPGDVITGASGQTVEIINTDAEGRLVLGDALWYARQQGVTHIVDLATLTGACVVALGKTTSGLFGRPDSWVNRVRAAGERAGERAWPMPVHDDYFDLLKSDIADFKNSGGRAGGAITGALFVKQFAGALPWAHIDIAGTAWADESTPSQPSGATGVGVRTLVELALASAAEHPLE